MNTDIEKKKETFLVINGPKKGDKSYNRSAKDSNQSKDSLAIKTNECAKASRDSKVEKTQIASEFEALIFK